MKIIVCLDDNNGMLFNKRRQSRDSKVIEDIWKMTDKLWIHSFSKKLFDDAEDRVIIDDEFLDKAGRESCCFVENQGIESYQEQIEKLVVYRWNRKYPADFKLDISLEKWNLIQENEFAGTSHETITKQIYTRKCL